MKDIENTKLWVRSLGDSSELYSDHRERLRTNFRTFRERSSVLVSRISQDLPGLTVHDVSHLDALWEVADLIAGADYPINPLEAFVFGGAVLLHDAALCFDAYKGGKQGIRASLYWRDAYSSETQRNSKITEDDACTAADFATIRHMHSAQASFLANMSWENGESDEMFLIDDTELRNCFGEVIGQIAASHHWDIEKLLSILPEQLNPPGVFPSEWTVDPVKLACLLRCADAAHIDSRRAPDFLYALVRRHGISLQHWKAQNRLSRVGPYRFDTESKTLLFTSSSAFPVEESESWWIAYDAICLVQRELTNSNNLLSSRLGFREKSPPFKMQHVHGVDSPSAAAKHIRVSGWMPCSAAVHVSDMHRLIERLGGEQLYGTGCDKLKIVLRELVQNSRDAIVARAHIDEEFCGTISVKLEGDEKQWTISISDDGVGMSQRVLTGSLLDFGTSFWSGNLVQDEFPGLRSSQFESVGRFGVGFFSIFMVAKSLEVESRRYDAGMEKVNRLLFPKGLTLRPTLVESALRLKTRQSTSIFFTLADGLVDKDGKISVGGIPGYNEKISVDFVSYMRTLVCGLDVKVKIVHGNNESTHSPIREIIDDIDRKSEWLEKIAYFVYISSNIVSREVINKYARRLRSITRGGKLLGLAAINTSESKQSLSICTVGGLENGRLNNIVGFFDHEPVSAKRENSPKPRANTIELEAWADDQMEILIKEGCGRIELAKATYSFSEIGIDPRKIFHAPFAINQNGNIILAYLSIDEIIGQMSGKGIFIYASSEHTWDYCRHLHGIPYGLEGPTFFPSEGAGSFYILDRNEPLEKKENTFLGWLSKYLNSYGLEINIEKGKLVARNPWGEGVFSWKITSSAPEEKGENF